MMRLIAVALVVMSLAYSPTEIGRDKPVPPPKRVDPPKRVHAVVSRGAERISLGTFEVTAYCLTGPTATGGRPRRGVVAVDPTVIPKYTKLYIEGYGEAIALDTGRAIKGKRIDVWLPTEKLCDEWGRQKKVNVWRLER